MLEIVLGLVAMVLNPLLALIFWVEAGVPFYVSLFFLVSYGTLWLAIIYYKVSYWLVGVGNKLIGLLEKQPAIQVLFEDIKRQMGGLDGQGVQGKTVAWLAAKGKKITLALIFLPWVPVLPTATIVAARLLKIKFAFHALFAGLVFRMLVLCWSVYGILSWFPGR